MKRPVRAQLAVLAGVFGFFLGGLINAGKELVDVMLGAVIGWGLVFFAAYMILENIYKGVDEEKYTDSKPAVSAASLKAERNKGKKIDIMAKSEDMFEDIYKMK